MEKEASIHSLHSKGTSEHPEELKETSDHAGVSKITRDAVVTETRMFKRSTRNGTFDNDSNDSLNQYYAPIESYEGRHRYDPKFEWDPKEEKRVVRKVCITNISVLVAVNSDQLTRS
jgi:hypothetical protein